MTRIQEGALSAERTPTNPPAAPRLVPLTSTTLRYMDPESLCPDLLSLDYIGPADHLRGRAVRLFFRLMQRWPKP